jgi:hypothetical protein
LSHVAHIARATYPPTAKIWTLPIMKVDLPKDTDVKEDNNEKSDSDKPPNFLMYPHIEEKACVKLVHILLMITLACAYG